jgi:hypothetical protein
MEVSQMASEDRAAQIVHRVLSLQSSFGQFERILTSQQRPDWNRAVAFVADELREAVNDFKCDQIRSVNRAWGFPEESELVP